MSRLHKDGVAAEKVQQADGRWRLEVEKGDTVRALSVVDSSRVLSRRQVGDGRAVKGSLLPTREEQWFQYETQVAGALESTLLTLPGVIDAHVHLHLPQSDPLLGNRDKAVGSGSVLLLLENQNGVVDEEVARMVAGGAGIPSEQVRVMRSLAEARSEDSEKKVSITPVVNPSEQDPFGGTTQIVSAPQVLLGIAITALLLVAAVIHLRRKRKREGIFNLPSKAPLMAQGGI